MKYILVFFILTFASSAAIAINSNYTFIEWKCIYCDWQWYGNDPPKNNKCYALKNGFHIWHIENIFIFEEKNNKDLLSYSIYNHRLYK